MAEFVTGLVVRDVGITHRRFEELFRTAAQVEAVYQRLGRPSPVAHVHRALLREYARFNQQLDAVAASTAIDATQAIKDRLEATKRRPDNALQKHHLRDMIVCRPLRAGKLATGAVGIAELRQLERATNPFDPSGFAYWVVQEEGTTANVGRELRGLFYDAGITGPRRPTPGYTGTPDAQPIFISGSKGGTRTGAVGGKGVIRQPIRARHFIRDGAAAAERRHALGVRGVEVATIANVNAILAGRL